MTCSCGTPLANPNWKYCPTCGRLAGRVVLPEDRLEFLFQPGKPSERIISVECEGARAIPYRASIEAFPGDAEAIHLVSEDQGEVLPGHHSLLIRIDRAPHDEVLFRLSTADGERPEDDPWELPGFREHTAVPIHVRLQAAAQLRVLPEAVFLTDSRPSRTLRLINPGSEELRVRLPDLPAGFGFGEDGRDHRRELLVPPGAQIPLILRLTGSGASTRTTLTFIPAPGRPVSIELERQTAVQEDHLPEFIVGIDFGTRNSSVYVRRVGYGSRGDEIEPATLPEDPTSRFPSALYQDSRGEWHFGHRALDRYQQEGRRRPLVRNVKRCLYEQSDPFLHLGTEYSRRFLLARFLGYIHKRAKQFCLTRWGDDLDECDVLYVCSLPLLDEERLELIREEISRAMQQAVLPPHRRTDDLRRWVTFAPEPVCAALYIIVDQRRVPVGDGERIVIFDSGGGTTDVVVGRSLVRHGQWTFEQEDQVGLDEDARTFGGNDVTARLIDPRLQNRLELVTRYRSTPAIQGLDEKLQRELLHEAMDPLKISASRGDHAAADLQQVVAAEFWGDTPREEQYVRMEDLDKVLEEHFLDGVLGPVEQRFFGGPEGAGAETEERTYLRREEIRHIFPVGGNSLLPRLIRGLRVLFHAYDDDRLVQLEEREVMEAVARGAVYYPDRSLRNNAGYALRVEARTARGTEILGDIRANAGVTAGRKNVRVSLTTQDVVVRVLTTIQGEERVLEEGTIPAMPELDVRCRVTCGYESDEQGPVIRVTHILDREEAQEQTLFVYPI